MIHAENMNTVEDIFTRYEAVRHRLPTAIFTVKTSEIGSLLDVAEQADAFVFDAFGVLNVGDTPIAGASERLDQLRERGCKIRILSNAASYDHNSSLRKFRNLGMKVESDEVVTSRDAALADLAPTLWGCIAAPSDALSDIKVPTCRLGDNPQDYDLVDGFLFLSTEVWTPKRQAHLERSLLNNSRPLVIANADVAAPRESGFSLEPGHFGHLLADRGIEDIRFFGKPFPQVFEMVEASLAGVEPTRIVMCGDTLHTDILGAEARGWRTALVTRDGLFSGSDVRPFCKRAFIHPDWSVPRI
jgi:ribonucleotide monophosphatase NagD (HAD superfamily)